MRETTLNWSVGQRAALLSLWSLTLFIQSTKGQARIPGPGGTPVAHLASNIIGISETNQTFNLTNTTVQFMRYPYSPFQQNTAIPTGSADNCSVASGGSFYLIGGYTVNGTAITNVQIYNAGSDSWSSGTVIPTPIPERDLRLEKRVFRCAGGNSLLFSHRAYRPQPRVPSAVPRPIEVSAASRFRLPRKP